MTTFAVHSKLIETQDLLDMLALYPTPAEYGDLYLFAQPHKNPTIEIIDLTHIEDLQEYDEMYEQLTSQTPVGKWVHITEDQGRFTLNKHFPPPLDEGSV